MRRAAVPRLWQLVHKWTSLACTAFLLLLCVTGLPLIFSAEIEAWLADEPAYAVLPADAPRADLTRLVAAAQARYPEEIVRFVFIDDKEPQVQVTLAPSPESGMEANHRVKFDARTGEILKEYPPLAPTSTFMSVVLSLHTDLFAGLAGELFLGTMAICFAAAVVSGVVLYAPFMRRLEFGTVRVRRVSRIRWLDLHNLLGIAAAAWMLVVGATGAINEMSTPLFALWRATEVKAMLEPYRGAPAPTRTVPVQQAFDTARRALPDKVATSVILPSARFGSPHHYLIWTQGDRALTSRLFTPVLVDARTGELTAVAPLPWYLTALELSRPLHFGDYGGLPLKILWALLDVMTIVILGSGLYLWLSRGRRPVPSRPPESRACCDRTGAGRRAPRDGA